MPLNTTYWSPDSCYWAENGKQRLWSEIHIIYAVEVNRSVTEDVFQCRCAMEEDDQRENEERRKN